jgi:hypothetical protein
MGAVIIITIVVVLGRLTVPGHELSWAGTYRALAHIWVGILMVLCIYPERHGPGVGLPEHWRDVPVLRLRVVAALCLLLSTAFETFMFLTR